MPQLVQHRVNTIAQLSSTPIQYGVELDIRDKYDELIIEHDAFNKGTNWLDYLAAYQHGLMIANIKTEGVEQRVITDLAAHNIDNYFLLDVSLPFLVKLSNSGFRKMAVRFSEYEPLDFVMKFAGKVDWLWADCFTKMPLDASNYEMLKKHFKICLVSPELHGRSEDELLQYKAEIASFEIDAICTKKTELWGN